MAVTEGAATGGVDAAGYDLTALGWLQFEQLCTELADLEQPSTRRFWRRRRREPGIN